MFFAFDGLDGVGKSTQIDRFCGWLRGLGLSVATCRDPGSTPLGERVREILLARDDELSIGMRSEMLLYMASRAQLVDQVIRPALAAGQVVVSDRFLLANVVYQGHAGGLAVEDLWRIGGLATDGVAPDCTLLLDMDPAAADRRIDRQRDRMEQRGDDYRAKLRAGFLAEAERDNRVHIVDAGRSIEAVHADILAIAEPIVGRRPPV